MKISQLIDTLYQPGSPKRLTPKQESIVKHPSGPAWVLAGPGSGKTEVLTVTVLRLLYVEDDPVQARRVPPEAIFVTTFTDKAAKSLEDRILTYRAKLVSSDSSLGQIDISKLRIGTLHGLANDILQEFRSPNYQNVRLMDEFEQALFVHEHMSIIKNTSVSAKISFWQEFPWLFTPQQWQPDRPYAPNRWNSSHALMSLLNRLVEDRVSISRLRAAGGYLGRLADFYDEYLKHLASTYRCDFSQLQARFLEFLEEPLGQKLLAGDGTDTSPGIQWVLVDEYQDTNPVQEEIYFRLAARAPHNLMVVGDDDQAMYRFRGGSVECMVTFDEACHAFLRVPKTNVSKYDLVENFRSHPDIVEFFNTYIRAFPLMQQTSARAPKPAIIPKRVIPQTYPAVGTLTGKSLADLADEFASTVRGLIDNRVVNDPNECCLLLKSTKETPHNALPYVNALRTQGLLVYNPRNKSFTEQEEVRALLGAILAIVDPARRGAQDPRNPVPKGEPGLRLEFDALLGLHAPLRNWVTSVTSSIKAKAGSNFDSNLQEITYYLLSMEPFNTWQQDPVRRVRLGRLTQLLEAYSSMPVLDPATGMPRPFVTRGFLRASVSHPGEVTGPWLSSFYHLFLGYVLDAGFDDEEEADTICPPGMVPVMTMHQAKGLEFPFVFVGHLGESPKKSAAHELETLFAAYPSNPARSFFRPPASERAELDMIRQYYVAYSRAKYALILLGTKQQFGKGTVPCGPAPNWIRHRTKPL